MSHFYFRHGGYDKPSGLTAIKYTSGADITYQVEHLRVTSTDRDGFARSHFKKASENVETFLYVPLGPSYVVFFDLQ